MDSLDSRLKRIEQRLSSIEKFVAENISPNRAVNRVQNQINSQNQNSVQDPLEPTKTMTEPGWEINVLPAAAVGTNSNVHIPIQKDSTKDYHYDYKTDLDASKIYKAPVLPVDTSVFNAPKKLLITDDTVTTATLGSVLIVGLFFVGRLMIESHLVNAVEQIALALLISSIFIGIGFLFEKNLGIYTKYFPMLGTVLLNVSLYGAVSFYKLLPLNLGLFAVLLNSGFMLYLNKKFKFEVFQILAAAGAYIVPLYMTFGADSNFSNFYYLIASLLFFIVSVMFDFTLLVSVAAFLALGASAVSEYIDNDTMNQVMFTMGHFVIFTSAYMFKVIRSDTPVSKNYSYSYFVFVIFFYLIEYYYISNSFRPQWTGLFTSLISATLFISFLILQNFGKPDKHQVTSKLLLASGVITLSHTLFYVLVPAKLRPMTLILSGFLSFKGLERLESQKWMQFSKLVMYFFLILIGWNYFEVLFSQFTAKNYLPMISGFIYVVVFLYATFIEKKIFSLNINPMAGLAFVHMMITCAIYNLTKNQSDTICIATTSIYALLGCMSMVFVYNRQNQE